MKSVYSASNISLISIFQNILEEQGIRSWLKNEFLSAGMGELPPIECWPQLCVNDDDYAQAKGIIEEALTGKNMTAWKCDTCGEKLEGQFTECWKCGNSRILAAD